MIEILSMYLCNDFKTGKRSLQAGAMYTPEGEPRYEKYVGLINKLPTYDVLFDGKDKDCSNIKAYCAYRKQSYEVCVYGFDDSEEFEKEYIKNNNENCDFVYFVIPYSTYEEGARGILKELFRQQISKEIPLEKVEET